MSEGERRMFTRKRSFSRRLYKDSVWFKSRPFPAIQYKLLYVLVVLKVAVHGLGSGRGLSTYSVEKLWQYNLTTHESAMLR